MNEQTGFSSLVKSRAELRELVGFVKSLKRMKIVGPGGETSLLHSPGSSNSLIDLRSIPVNDQSAANDIPAQTGHAGHVLHTNGATPYWAAPAGVRYYTEVARVATQSTTSGNWNQLVSFDTGIYNSSGMWNAGQPTRVTIQPGQDGLYFGHARVVWRQHATGLRGMQVMKNGSGSPFIDSILSASAGVPTYKTLSFSIPMVAGDYLELTTRQDSGANLLISDGGSCFLVLYRIGDSPV
jgi:hypothetical protein